MAIGTPVTLGDNFLGSSATTTVTLTLAAGVTIGDLIIVWGTNDGGANLPSGVTDTQGHTYLPDITGVISADNYALRQFSTVCTSTMTTSDVITLTVDGGGGNWDKLMAAAKCTPDAGRTWGASRVDQTVQATGSSTAPDSGLTATTTDADALIFGSMAAGGAPSTTSGGPLTAATNSNTRLHNRQGSAFIDGGSVYRVVTSASTYRASGTWQSSDAWGCVCVAYKQQALAGAEVIPSLVMAPPIPA